MSNPIEENCTHDCSTCSGACSGTDHKFERTPGIFDQIDGMVEMLNTEEAYDMLTKLAEELEKEMAE